MIYLFFGEKHFRDKTISSWKKAFEEKYSELNIFHIKNYLEYDFSFYAQNFLSNSFFSDKNFFIIDDFPFNVGEKDENINSYSEYFLNILDKISKENIIVFNNETVDKRSKLYKKIQEIGEIKNYSIDNKDDLEAKISQVYSGKISPSAVKKIIELKKENFSLIQNELDKIFITKDFVNLEDLNLISKEFDDNIFDIVNDILGNQTKNALIKLKELSFSLDNPFLLYNSLVANLRIYFYIFFLKDNSYSDKNIIENLNLGNRGFLVGKKYQIDRKKFYKMYENLSKIDEKLKTGKLIGNDNEEFLYEIEKIIIKYS